MPVVQMDKSAYETGLGKELRDEGYEVESDPFQLSLLCVGLYHGFCPVSTYDTG